MLIDDDAVTQSVLQRILQKEGYDVIVVADGAETVTMARSRRPSLILLDVMMPGIDGFDLITRLKKEQELAHIPVIFITARDDVQSKIAGFDLGAVDYIVKPFNKYEIVARVKIHLRLSGAVQDG
jgi:sigma-B regulation protein RsbU (phosphoserine phosphatase)